MATPRSVFVNIAVSDLKRSKEFFSKLGFTYNPQFTNDDAACMVVSETSYFMLVTKPMFQGFTKRAISDATKQTEAMFAFSCSSRAEVDQLAKTALANGGSAAMDPQDHGFMYSWSFYDPDGHHFEVFWMDPAHLQK